MQTLIVSKRPNKAGTTTFYSNFEWFRECKRFAFKEKDGYLIITKQRLNVSKSSKICTFRKDCKGNQFEFISDVEPGTYEIDLRLSNEDQLFINLNQ